MHTRLQTACAWCGPAFVVVFFGGLLIAGMFPPPSPSDSAAEVAAFWRGDTDLIRLGIFMMVLAAGLTAPLVVVISVQLKRIEGEYSPMSSLQLLAGAIGVVAITVPLFFFAAAAFRPERSPESLQLLTDLAWIPFIANIVPAILQCCAIGVAVIRDRSEAPIFPRWVAYYNFWCAFLFIPGGLAMFFKSGAFAWNGLLAFWLAATIFGTWFLVMSAVVRRAVHKTPAASAPERELVAA